MDGSMHALCGDGFRPHSFTAEQLAAVQQKALPIVWTVLSEFMTPLCALCCGWRLVPNIHLERRLLLAVTERHLWRTDDRRL